MIPVTVITGFLGAGKTTLLRRLLADPAHADSAVLVNELGEIPLDHELMAVGNETFVSAATGCLCCTLRSDIAQTLLGLHAQRSAGQVPRYARVLVETSGMADPAPILHTLMTDTALRVTHALNGVVTLVDAVHGAQALDAHPEAQRQARLADRLVITKPDLAPTAALRERLATLNPAADLREAVRGDLPANWLFQPLRDAAALSQWLDVTARHSRGVSTAIIEREAPIPALALTLFLQGLAEHLGPRLLRLKGLIAIAESPAQPAALHGIGHVLHAPEFLDAWPSDDHRSRLVIIAQGVPPHWPARLLAALEDEVNSALG